MSPAPSTSGSPTAVSVASHASPGSTVRPLPASHSVLGSEPSPTTTASAGDARAVGQLDRLDPAAPEHRGDAGAEAQIDAVAAVELRAPRSQDGTERRHGRRRDVDQRHLEAELARGLRDLAADEARAHDDEARTPLERGAQRDAIVEARAGRAGPPDRRRRPSSAGPSSRSPGSRGRRAPRRRRRAPRAGASRSRLVAATPSRHCASSSSQGSWTRSTGCSPASSSFDSGGRV